jgi:uncharacterized protein (DUF1697 family)
MVISARSLVVLLRGVNVGGHRRFSPAALARSLSRYDVVNVGAAGTFVVRKPGSVTRFRAALLSKLPFETTVVICDGRAFARLETDHPFDARQRPGEVRFVTILSKASTKRPPIPFALPATGKWLVRVIASDGQFVFGTYRRDMKTIRYIGEADKRFGAAATTRNWNTVMNVIRILKDPPVPAGSIA